MSVDEFQAIVSDRGDKKWYSYTLEELLDNIYTIQWTLTYTFNFGKHWISFKNLLEERFNDGNTTIFNFIMKMEMN
ncbi:hypothetical protein [Aneurinibacillus terranovensis]|uniref:hypothetical protein n=1 Tax=Aneurinibacillus terranovensis TaxID=278991 RepID=UPI000414FDDE|nr:hypothetical protein [Aneurinibacillus terranovensis]